jgi:serine protease Do
MRIEFFHGRRFLATAAIVTGIGVTGFFGLRAAENPAPTVRTSTRSEAAEGRGYAAVVKRVVPAVVNISTSKIMKQTAMEMPDGDQSQGMDPQDLPPMFRQFFGNGRGNGAPRQSQRPEKALGSGVIVSPQGYILTNNHVVDGATTVTVTLHDKREFKARVIGQDARTDIALLKIDGSNFPVLTLADSSKVEVGDICLAIGNPFGVGQTVTAGIVSATGRGGLGIEQVEDFIQTDAPINPGNSGGALVDDEGHLIGINTAILAGNSGGNQGIGFAIPINMARHDMDEIVAHGKVDHGYLGILPQDVTPALAQAFHAPDTNGALVGDITADSPAAHSSLKQGDIIVAVNGQPVGDASGLRTKIGMLDPNTTAMLKVLRNGTPMEVSVTLGDYPTKEESASNKKPDSDSSLQGVTVQNSDKGVVVGQVDPSSKAADAGLEPGDVIKQVNHQAVANVRQYTQAVSSSKKDSVLLLVDRNGNTIFLAV